MKPISFIAILSLIATQALVFSACSSEEEQNQQSISRAQSLTLSVDLPCDRCIAHVKGKLHQMAGLKIVAIERGQKDNLRLLYEADKTSPEAIKKALAEIGKEVQ